jgi:hypothetical protein
MIRRRGRTSGLPFAPVALEVASREDPFMDRRRFLRAGMEMSAIDDEGAAFQAIRRVDAEARSSKPTA